MRSRNALARALISLCAAVLCLLPLGTQARADDPTPRAATAARAFPRQFASYTALVEFAAAFTAEQTRIDAKLLETRAARAAVVGDLGVVESARSRGGALFDEAGERERHQVAVRLRAYASRFARAEQELVAAGALTNPVTPWRMPTEGEITQPFGPTDLWVEPARDYDGGSYAHFHEGVDIAGEWAAPVVAPARGRVVFVGMMSDGAEVVVLAHDGGIVTMYAHLDASNSPPPVAVGDEVAAGQRIGTVGLTGMTTGAHLHWAAYRDGNLIDPLSLLPN